MSNYRENDDISDMRTNGWPWRFWDLVVVIGVVTLILGLYLFAQATDDRAARRESMLLSIERQRLPIPADVQAAYERGLTDAVMAMQDSAERTRLTPSCAAQGSGQ